MHHILVMNAHSLAAAVGSVAASADSTASAAILIALGFFFAFLIAVIVACVFILIGEWKVYVKAGRKGWTCLIPFYKNVVFLDMVNEPLWWIALFFIPVVNLVVWFIVAHRIARVFGHDIGFALGLFFLPFIFWPLLGFGEAVYKNEFPPAMPMSDVVKWSLLAAAYGSLSWMLYSTSVSMQDASMGRQHPLTILDSDTLNPNSGNETMFATDGQYVYVADKMIKGADPTSFTIRNNYETDMDHVYYSGVVVDGADPDSFKLMDGEYARDGAHVYFGGVPTTIDVTSAKQLDPDIVVDGAHVYMDGQPIDGADPATFALLKDGYDKDSRNIYYDGQIVDGADVSTFDVISDPQGTYDARDSKHKYQYGQDISKPQSTSMGE